MRLYNLGIINYCIKYYYLSKIQLFGQYKKEEKRFDKISEKLKYL